MIKCVHTCAKRSCLCHIRRYSPHYVNFYSAGKCEDYYKGPVILSFFKSPRRKSLSFEGLYSEDRNFGQGLIDMLLIWRD